MQSCSGIQLAFTGFDFWVGWSVGLAWLGSLIYEHGRTDDTAERFGYVYILELDYVNDSDHNL